MADSIIGEARRPRGFAVFCPRVYPANRVGYRLVVVVSRPVRVVFPRYAKVAIAKLNGGVRYIVLVDALHDNH